VAGFPALAERLGRIGRVEVHQPGGGLGEARFEFAAVHLRGVRHLGEEGLGDGRLPVPVADDGDSELHGDPPEYAVGIRTDSRAFGKNIGDLEPAGPACAEEGRRGWPGGARRERW
jgi:hypothetical protein